MPAMIKIMRVVEKNFRNDKKYSKNIKNLERIQTREPLGRKKLSNEAILSLTYHSLISSVFYPTMTCT